MPVPHCPHCLMPIADGSTWPYPAGPARCPHCRLIIGPGRARPDTGDEAGDARSRGSAAGVLANAARRQHSETGDRGQILDALRTVAGTMGCPVERLRMLDYQEESGRRADKLPDLGTVLATFGTWKAARAAAAATGPTEGDEDDTSPSAATRAA